MDDEAIVSAFHFSRRIDGSVPKVAVGIDDRVDGRRREPDAVRNPGHGTAVERALNVLGIAVRQGVDLDRPYAHGGSELGHNFDSRHTHCYNTIPAPEDPPIDHCFTGDTTATHACYVGPTGLPVDGGSIMSYCHLQPGGYGNINLWLGRAGSFGSRSERVPQQMRSHVESVAGCLQPIPSPIFADGFETGDTSACSGQ